MKTHKEVFPNDTHHLFCNIQSDEMMAQGMNTTLNSLSLTKTLLEEFKKAGSGKDITSPSTMATHSFVPKTPQIHINNNVYNLPDF